jgi:hypothetical protein
MPLLDHCNPPMSRMYPGRCFHSAWAAATARLLNQGILPPGFYALPLVGPDEPIEIDTTAPAPQTWGPPAPGLAVAVELTAPDGVEVQVFAEDGDRKPAAAVELLSPRDKDRPATRQAFAVKCVG